MEPGFRRQSCGACDRSAENNPVRWSPGRPAHAGSGGRLGGAELATGHSDVYSVPMRRKRGGSRAEFHCWGALRVNSYVLA